VPGDRFTRCLQEAQAYIDIHRWVDAEKSARAALTIVPDNYQAQGLLAEALIGAENFNESIRVAQRMIAAAPDLELGFRQLAVALHYSGKPKAAIDPIRQSLSLDPENEFALITLCVIQCKLKQKIEAQVTADRLLALYPDNVLAHTAMAEVANIRRKWKDMACHAEQVLKINPEDERAIYLLGFSYMKQDKDAEAINVLHMGVSLHPQSEDLMADLKWIADLYVGSAWPAAVLSIFLPGAILYFLWDMIIGKRRRIAKLSEPAQAYVRQRLRLRNSLVIREAAFLLGTLIWTVWLWLWINMPEKAPGTALEWTLFATALLMSGGGAWSTWRWLSLKRGLL